MKRKSLIGILLVGAMMFMTTSCADMFNIESNRVVYDNSHDLGSTADSVYSVMGILHAFQQIADRYVILGEVRGDLVDVNEHTKASLRNLADFNYEPENEYIDASVYYNVINNCNYLIANMDTTLRHNNTLVMTDEYVAALSIRAWTYMQLAINFGKVPYYTQPITTVAASEADYPMYDVKQLALELIPQLLPYMDYKLPKWTGISAGGTEVSEQLFPPIQLILGDLYLWLGDYKNAWDTYHAFITDNKTINMRVNTGSETSTFNGYVSLGNGQAATTAKNTERQWTNRSWVSYTKTLTTILGSGYEALCVVPMQTSTQDGTVSEVPSLFYSNDNTHQLTGSARWEEIGKAQTYVLGPQDAKAKEAKSFTYLSNKGDQRVNAVIKKFEKEEDEFEVINKFYDGGTTITDGTKTIYTIDYLTLYRRGLVYLRAAEAANCLAAQEHDASLSVQAFGILRDGFDILFPNGNIYKDEIQPYVLGVHSRGCGDVYYDTLVYVVRDENIAQYYNKEIEAITFNDTLNFVEDHICDELAMETSFEGNRFTDLIRFAERRGPAYLAEKVACRKGSDNRDEALYQKLLNKDNWYLPLR